MNWIDVVDSAVKIGLGALISGITALVLTSTQHRNSLEKSKVDREFEMLKEVAEKIEAFNQVSLKYWALSTDWRRRWAEDNTVVQTKMLKNSYLDLFNSFSELTKAESLLLLFGHENAQLKLREYGEVVIDFYKAVKSTDIAFDSDDSVKYRESIVLKRSELFSILHNIYKTI
jgi:hypothetical protein